MPTMSSLFFTFLPRVCRVTFFLDVPAMMSSYEQQMILCDARRDSPTTGRIAIGPQNRYPTLKPKVHGSILTVSIFVPVLLTYTSVLTHSFLTRTSAKRALVTQ